MMEEEDERDDPAKVHHTAFDCVTHKNTPHITQEHIQAISQDYNILPTFAYKLNNIKEMQEHSFTDNHSIRCKWKKYVRDYGISKALKKNVKEFPHTKHNHFFNYYCRYLPSLSPGNRTERDNRYKMTCGPGNDQLGQIPIPIEALTVRKT